MSKHDMPHTHQVDVEALLHTQGVRYTEQRRLTWALFTANPQGYSISEAATALKPAGVGAATVYRTIELFVKLGILTRTQDIPWKARYVAVCPGHKHVLICRGCRQTVEFEDCDLSMLEKLLSAKTGYIIGGHHLEIYGTCPECRV